MQSPGSLFWAPAGPLCVCPGHYLGVGLVRPAEPPSSTRRQPQTRSTTTSTVTNWARPPATAPRTLGPTDHRTPRRSLVTISPRTQPPASPGRTHLDCAHEAGSGGELRRGLFPGRGVRAKRVRSALPGPSGPGPSSNRRPSGTSEATTCVTGALLSTLAGRRRVSPSTPVRRGVVDASVGRGGLPSAGLSESVPVNDRLADTRSDDELSWCLPIPQPAVT